MKRKLKNGSCLLVCCVSLVLVIGCSANGGVRWRINADETHIGMGLNQVSLDVNWARLLSEKKNQRTAVLEKNLGE